MRIIKLKVVTRVFLFVLACTTAQAASRDGFYVGIGAGSSFDHFTLKTKNLNTGFQLKSPEQAETNWIGNIFGGFGYTTDGGLYLAGEVGTYLPERTATINNRPGISVNNLTFNDKIGVQDYLTFDVLPGFRLNESILLYVRGGLTYAHTNFNQSASGYIPSLSDEDSRWGGRAGAGIHFGFNQNVGLSLDYIYSRYLETTTNYPTFATRFTSNVYSNYVGITASYSL